MAPHDEQTSDADSSLPSAPLPQIGLRAPITAFDVDAPNKVALVRQVGVARRIAAMKAGESRIARTEAHKKA